MNKCIFVILFFLTGTCLYAQDNDLLGLENKDIYKEKKINNRVRSVEQEFMIKGYSLGLDFFNHNYNITSTLLINDGLPTQTRSNLVSSSPDFLSLGAGIRYSAIPIEKIGSMFGAGISSTINHSNINYGAVYMLRLEMALTYAMYIRDWASYYYLGGGYEIAQGDIKNVINVGGGGLILGAGTRVSDHYRIEFSYQYFQHDISTKLRDDAIQSAFNKGATTATIDGASSKVNSHVVMGRLLWTFE